MGAARPARRAARASRRGRAAQPEPRLAVRDARHCRCWCSRCCPGPHPDVRAARRRWRRRGRGRSCRATRRRPSAGRRSRARSRMHSATIAHALGARGGVLVVAGGAALEARARPSSEPRRRLRQGLTAHRGDRALVAVVAGGSSRPETRSRAPKKRGTASRAGTGSRGGSRLVSGLGSNRYDFYRVALDEFLAHPLVGIGADNFQQQYLRHGHSGETPHYPHSVELRTLSQTGVIGTLLALLGLGAALLAAMRARAAPDRLGAGVAAAALAGFGYWVVHGSVDWFWEFAGLGAPAFAMLGLSCALSAPRDAAATPPARGAHAWQRRPPAAPRAAGRRARRGRRRGGVCVVPAASLAAPWLSGLEVERRRASGPATGHRLRPPGRRCAAGPAERRSLTSSRAASRCAMANSARADREFSRRSHARPDDAYATLERGAIASSRGERARALALLNRAAAPEPARPADPPGAARSPGAAAGWTCGPEPRDPAQSSADPVKGCAEDGPGSGLAGERSLAISGLLLDTPRGRSLAYVSPSRFAEYDGCERWIRKGSMWACTARRVEKVLLGPERDSHGRDTGVSTHADDRLASAALVLGLCATIAAPASANTLLSGYGGPGQRQPGDPRRRLSSTHRPVAGAARHARLQTVYPLSLQLKPPPRGSSPGDGRGPAHRRPRREPARARPRAPRSRLRATREHRRPRWCRPASRRRALRRSACRARMSSTCCSPLPRSPSRGPSPANWLVAPGRATR